MQPWFSVLNHQKQLQTYPKQCIQPQRCTVREHRCFWTSWRYALGNDDVASWIPLAFPLLSVQRRAESPSLGVKIQGNMAQRCTADHAEMGNINKVAIKTGHLKDIHQKIRLLNFRTLIDNVPTAIDENSSTVLKYKTPNFRYGQGFLSIGPTVCRHFFKPYHHQYILTFYVCSSVCQITTSKFIESQPLRLRNAGQMHVLKRATLLWNTSV